MPSQTMGAAPSGSPSGTSGGVVSSSSRKSANRYFSEETMPSSVTRGTSGRLLRRKLRRLLRQPPLQRIEVLEQARGGQFQVVEPEGRILHIELLDLIVAHAQDYTAFDAFQRLRSHVRRRQHA